MTAVRAIAVVLLATLGSGRAGAQTPTTPARPLSESLSGAAREEYRTGRLLFDDGDYAGALVKFENAFAQSGDPRLLWNIATCEKNLRRYTRVLRTVERYRRESEGKLDAKSRAEADALVVTVRSLVSQLELVVDQPGAAIFIDDERAGTTPSREPLLVDLGKRRVRVSKPGFVDAVVSQEFTGGSSVTLSLVLTPAARGGRLSIDAGTAMITLDGKFVGQGRWDGSVASGSHLVRASAPGMEPQSTEVVIGEGETRAITLTMTADKARKLPTLVWVAGGALLAGGREGEPRRPAAGPSGEEAPDAKARDRAIREVLDRRAAAVLARDRAAFLADVDRTDPEFVAAQEQLFDNLEQVRFLSWRYETVGRDYDRPDLADTYDRPYHLPALLLHYRLAGFDAAPVARPQVLTFVRAAGGRWLVASDSDADADLPETGHADPWDRRPIVVGEGRHALVLADAEDRRRLDRLVAVSDRAVRRVAQMWPSGWRRRVVVVAVRDQTLIETYFRTALQSSENVAAVAVPAFDVVPGWSEPGSGTAGADVQRSRVILNPRFFDAGDEGNVDLLTHEVAHVATQGRTWAGAPTWLVEGAAEYTAYRHLRPFSVRLPPALRREVAAGSVDLPTYDFYARDVEAHYLAGFLACAYVADRYGEATLRELYGRLARTEREIDTLARQDEVVRQTLGISVARLSREVAEFARGVSR